MYTVRFAHGISTMACVLCVWDCKVEISIKLSDFTHSLCFSSFFLFQMFLLQNISVQDNRLSGSVSRTMAAMSLGFIVVVTPWSIQEVVAACTGSKVILRSSFAYSSSS